jgi:glycosyltransferase involved in cell wall biosynthesis
MASKTQRLLDDDFLRRELGAQAAIEAPRRFDLNRQANEFLEWYQEILEQRIIKI